MKNWHIGRSFSGTRLEDDCPCPKAPCGLVDSGDTHPDCEQHPQVRYKTIRQSHRPDECLAVVETLESAA
jgi:hypothetical protein